MPRLVGGLAALVALAAGILSHVDPVTSVLRALLAFIVGSIATQLWYVFFATRVVRPGGGNPMVAVEAPMEVPPSQ
jgi:hypothetical protein